MRQFFGVDSEAFPCFEAAAAVYHCQDDDALAEEACEPRVRLYQEPSRTTHGTISRVASHKRDQNNIALCWFGGFVDQRGNE